jgi:hypothetical protein
MSDEDKAGGTWAESDCGRCGRDCGGGCWPQSGGDGLVGACTVLNNVGVGLRLLRDGWAILCSGLGPLTLFPLF